jgi:hypothetical protein
MERLSCAAKTRQSRRARAGFQITLQQRVEGIEPWVALGGARSPRNFKQKHARENRQAFTIITSKRHK